MTGLTSDRVDTKGRLLDELSLKCDRGDWYM